MVRAGACREGARAAEGGGPGGGGARPPRPNARSTPACTCSFVRTYMNNHVHSAPQPKKEENREKEESHTLKQTKIHNNLSGLEKYS